MITTYSMAFDGRGFSLPQIHHPNFTEIYELYYAKDQVFVVSEYLDFSLEDLLKQGFFNDGNKNVLGREIKSI